MEYVKLKTAINKIKDNSNLYMTVKDDNEHLYSIKNGICYVRLNGLVLSGKGRVTVPTGTFPIPDNSITNGHFPVITNNNNCYLAVLSSSGGLSISCDTETGTIKEKVIDGANNQLADGLKTGVTPAVTTEIESTISAKLQGLVKAGTITPDMKVMISGFGVGLSWGGTILRL